MAQQCHNKAGHSGHSFPSSCPSSLAHCALLFAQELTTIKKKLNAFPFTQVKDIFQDGPGNEAVEKRELVGIKNPPPYLAIPVTSSEK